MVIPSVFSFIWVEIDFIIEVVIAEVEIFLVYLLIRESGTCSEFSSFGVSEAITVFSLLLLVEVSSVFKAIWVVKVCSVFRLIWV